MALFDRKMKDPVAGTARVVDNGGLRSVPGESIHCPLDLMVEAEGIPAYAVHIKVRPKTGKWPSIHQILPVLIDHSDPTRVEVVWDQVPSLLDRIAQAKAHTPLATALADPMESLLDQIAQAKAHPAPTPTDPVDQLAKLADLRDRGVLTETEFEAQKRRILGG